MRVGDFKRLRVGDNLKRRSVPGWVVTVESVCDAYVVVKLWSGQQRRLFACDARYWSKA